MIVRLSIDVVTGMAADYMSTESDTSSISSFAAFSESLASPTPSESVMVFSDNFRALLRWKHATI